MSRAAAHYARLAPGARRGSWVGPSCENLPRRGLVRALGPSPSPRLLLLVVALLTGCAQPVQPNSDLAAAMPYCWVRCHMLVVTHGDGALTVNPTSSVTTTRTVGG